MGQRHATLVLVCKIGMNCPLTCKKPKVLRLGDVARTLTMQMLCGCQILSKLITFSKLNDAITNMGPHNHVGRLS